jgi:hypothetical protein
MGSFPTVLRSDNAAEFVGDVVSCLNTMLEIKHITGSAMILIRMSVARKGSQSRTPNNLINHTVEIKKKSACLEASIISVMNYKTFYTL